MIHVTPPPPVVWRRPASALLFLLLASHAGGCAAVPIAALGSVLGVTASAVSTGGDIYRLGKLDAVEVATFDEAVEAAYLAAAELRLTNKGAEPRKGGAVQVSFADDKGAGMKVRVEPRTPRLVRVRVDVGWFGSEMTARLFLTRLRVYLPKLSAPAPDPDRDPSLDAEESRMSATLPFPSSEEKVRAAGHDPRGDGVGRQQREGVGEERADQSRVPELAGHPDGEPREQRERDVRAGQREPGLNGEVSAPRARRVV